jgi:hypothetical protein
MAVNSFNAQNPPVTTKGDVFTFSTIPTRLAVGANNTVLTADSAEATGLKWAAPSSTPTMAGVLCFKTNSQSISSGTYTAVTFDSEVFDTDSYHSTSSNTSRITIPTGKGGYYIITAGLAYAYASVLIPANIAIYLNGSEILNQAFSAEIDVNGGKVLAFPYYLNASDYIEVFTRQTSGANRTVGNNSTNVKTTYFGVSFLGA